MVKFYYNQVVNHGMPIEKVPEKWRSSVEKMLEENSNA